MRRRETRDLLIRSLHRTRSYVPSYAVAPPGSKWISIAFPLAPSPRSPPTATQIPAGKTAGADADGVQALSEGVLRLLRGPVDAMCAA